MKQHGDEKWSGHREITQEAVRRLFANRAGFGGRIRGLDERRYFEVLDKAQAHQDRLFGVGLIRRTSITLPYAGPGPTTHSAYANPGAQREHFMADPRRSGPENLRINTAYILGELVAARREGGPQVTRKEMTHLGAAAHALQDSYSGAHAWRENSVYDGKVDAPLQSFHVFTPGHVVGLDKGRNTHDDHFDKPPAESGSTRAAIEATYRMLLTHEDGYATSPDQAALAMDWTIGPMVHPSAAGVTVNLTPDARWKAERDRRMGLENSSAEVARLTRMGLEKSSAEVARPTWMMAGQAKPETL